MDSPAAAENLDAVAKYDKAVLLLGAASIEPENIKKRYL